jgi:hypothetical protein
MHSVYDAMMYLPVEMNYPLATIRTHSCQASMQEAILNLGIRIQWGNIISTHLDQQGIKSISPPWGATLLEINWRFVLSMWVLRNDEQHGKDSIDKTKSKKQKLIKELTKMMKQNQDLPGSQIEMIDVSPERCWDLSTHQLQAHVYGASIITNIHNQYENNKQEQRFRQRG